MSPRPMYRPSPTTLGASLFAKTPARRLALLHAVWPAAVGPDLARRSTVVAFDAGVLRVRVPDASWRKVLFRMRGDILARLRASAGPAAPRALGFVEGPVADPTPPTRARPAGPAPPPPGVVAAADAIADDDLRGRFVDAAARYLARFGGPAG